LNLQGNPGGNAIALSATQYCGGAGANAPFFGVGGAAKSATTGLGNAGSGYGCGPSGSVSGPNQGVGQPGVAGFPGAILLLEMS
jgi:hypothetical protein